MRSEGWREGLETRIGARHEVATERKSIVDRVATLHMFSAPRWWDASLQERWIAMEMEGLELCPRLITGEKKSGVGVRG